MPEQLLFAVTKKFQDSVPATDESSDSLKHNESSSVFKETNTVAADLIAECATRLPPALKATAAYQTLERSLIEFANNSEQANATTFTVSCYLNEEGNQIRFVVYDNGDGLKPDYITARYDWESALQKRSIQASAEETTVKKSSGQHLGLSTAAYLLERKGGNLGLDNNKGKKGARITVTSSLEACDTALFDQPSDIEPLKINEISPNNIVEEMLHCIMKKQADDKSQIIVLQNITKSSASKTLQHAAKALKNRLELSPVNSNGANASFSTTPLSTKKGRPPSLSFAPSSPMTFFTAPPPIKQMSGLKEAPEQTSPKQ